MTVVIVDDSADSVALLERAAALLREESGTHFDPACVHAFFAAWPEMLEVREGFRDPETDRSARLARNVQRLEPQIQQAA